MGSQYRSAIFYYSQEQRQTAEKLKKDLQEAGIWSEPVVTEIVPLKKFYPAEEYHRDYLQNHPENQYCQMVVIPKVEKFKKTFQDYLKRESEKRE